ncbi:carboxymuconolactone decarboxylase family protein [Paenibacillus hodogayensis]|uniref:Carboxymuconolactone decarboxylase family protein n=1 Tax=Paenibacillus hodogayensis TaxID=279208 RepID=A0ABV5VXX1_9BACL
MNAYYAPANLQRIPDLVRQSPEAAAAYVQFEREAYRTSALPPQTKELLALTVAHVTGCPYCIDVHVKKYKALGGTMEEITEALLVAAATRAGAILSHGVNALLSYEEGAESDNPGEPEDGKAPKCF